MDARLSEEEEQAIQSIIMEHSDRLIGFHNLRTRRSGSHRYVDLHLVVPGDANINTAHELCDHLEEDIKKVLPRTDLTIHVEPCTDECDDCPRDDCMPGKKNKTD
jgi:divalent metal cation (Fe/Co/Zn/Cd) transporter